MFAAKEAGFDNTVVVDAKDCVTVVRYQLRVYVARELPIIDLQGATSTLNITKPHIYKVVMVEFNKPG